MNSSPLKLVLPTVLVVTTFLAGEGCTTSSDPSDTETSTGTNTNPDTGAEGMTMFCGDIGDMVECDERDECVWADECVHVCLLIDNQGECEAVEGCMWIDEGGSSETSANGYCLEPFT